MQGDYLITLFLRKRRNSSFYLEIPDIMKQRFPSYYKNLVVNSLDEFKNMEGEYEL